MKYPCEVSLTLLSLPDLFEKYSFFQKMNLKKLYQINMNKLVVEK